MIIKRILNNNAVMSVDESGEDIIVKGKGIAFQKKSGDEINQNKIDKIFVDDIKNSDSNTNVTDTIIDLGHKMELTIIAEGVETEAQLAYLIEKGCDVIQGYLYSKPLPEKELEKWICNF